MTSGYTVILWELVLADDPQEIARLEDIAQATQAEAVDHFIERFPWSADVASFVGGKGTAATRRAALVAALQASRGRKH